MKVFKRFTSFILAITLCTLIVGCGATSSTNNRGKKSSIVTGPTLTIAARDGSHTDVINAVKGTFEDENNCIVNVVSMSASDLRNSIIESSDQEEGVYDVVMIDDPLMPEYIEKDVLYNLTQLGYSDDDDFVEKSRLLGKDPYPLGATYALPFSGNVQLIFYNSAVTGDNPNLESWEDILAICEDAKSQGKKGYAIRGQAGNPIVSDFLPILWAFGGDLFDENNNVILNSPQSIEALEFYRKLYETGGNYEKDDLTAAISDGKAGIALGWPSWFITGSGPTASIAEIPGKKSATSEALATGEIGNWLLGVTKNSKTPDIALKLAEYLTSANVQREALSYGGIPTRKSIFRDPKILAQYPYFEQIYNGTNNSRVRPRTTKWSKIEEVLGEELIKCIEGEQGVPETISMAHVAIANLGKEP